jgi:hypothetical protein
MNSKVSSDWLPSYIKAKRPVLEIFKMAGYFPDSPSSVAPFYQLQQFEVILHIELKMNQKNERNERKERLSGQSMKLLGGPRECANQHIRDNRIINNGASVPENPSYETVS